MSPTDVPTMHPDAAAAQSRGRAITFWIATLFVTLTALAAGIADIAHAQPLFGIVLHLGYPPYFATVLGLWKIAGAIALLAPRSPLLKEWAYAGMFFDYCCATASHVAVGDELATVIGPAVSLGALAASYLLRPPSRRLALR